MKVRSLCQAFASGLIYRPLLLIYQMGKVGSQTIEATLRALDLPHLIYRPHFLSSKRLEIMRDRLKNASMPDHERGSLRTQLAEATLLQEALAARILARKWGCPVRPVQIITGIREPVSQMLATLFQLHGTYFGGMEKITLRACLDLLLVSPVLDSQRAHYMKTMRAGWGNWFDEEFKSVTGIDVYNRSFPHEKGYTILEDKFARVLVYRFENFSSLGKMLEDFLGKPVPSVINQNISTEKDYATYYQAVKKQLRLPTGFLEEMYSSKPVLHFYTLEERARLIRRWQAAE